MAKIHNFEATVCLAQGQTEWHYVLLPKDIADKIRARRTSHSPSVNVEVSVDKTTWQTKLFDHKESQSYLLPLNTKAKAGEKVKVALLVTN